MLECWGDDLIRVTSLLRSSIAPELLFAAAWQNLNRFYPLLLLGSGYALLMLFNPVRRTLGDGVRCIGRYKRIWISLERGGSGWRADGRSDRPPPLTWLV